MRRLCVLAGLVLALAIPSRGHAAITYLTQQRFVRANGDVNGQPTGQSPLNAVGFTPFNGVRDWTLFNDFTSVGSIHAAQQSSLLTDRILFQGNAETTITSSLGAPTAQAVSRLIVGFTLPASSGYSIEHSHSIGGAFGQRIAMAELSGPSGTVFSWNHSNLVADSWPQSPFTGVLVAGQYQLTIDVNVFRGSSAPGGGLGTTTSGVTFELIIPGPSTGGCVFITTIAIGVRPSRKRLNTDG